jgi:TPP-dependent pyruvate/acetoin dehydrogenase alpha subunit
MNVLTPEKIEEIKKGLENELSEAEKFAEESAWPDPGEVTDDVYTV